MVDIGFERSRLDAGIFIRGAGSEQVVAVIHVDDAIIVGSRKNRAEVMTKLRAKFALKHEHTLEETGDRVKLLGRSLLKTGRGYAMVNEETCVKDLAGIFGLTPGTSKEVTTPTSPTDRAEGDTTPVDDEKKQELRTAIGKLLWLANDRPDIKYAVGRLAGQVANMTANTWAETKQVLAFGPVRGHSPGAEGYRHRALHPQGRRELRQEPGSLGPTTRTSRRRQAGKEEQENGPAEGQGERRDRRAGHRLRGRLLRRQRLGR